MIESIDRLKVTASSHRSAFLVEVMGRDYLALMAGITGGAEVVVFPEMEMLVGLLKGEVSATPLVEVTSNRKTLDLQLLEVARILAQ